MSQAPSMPLFCDAYLADTMHLSLEEHGAYLKLLMITWRNNGQPLPDDDARIARMLGVPVSRWVKHLRPAIENFFDTSEGFFRQKRLEKEWQFVCAHAEKQRDRANKRWTVNPLKNIGTGDAVALPRHIPQGMPERYRDDAPNPNPIIENIPAAALPIAARDGAGGTNAAADAGSDVRMEVSGADPSPPGRKPKPPAAVAGPRPPDRPVMDDEIRAVVAAPEAAEAQQFRHSAPPPGPRPTVPAVIDGDGDALVAGLDAAITRYFDPSCWRQAPHPTDPVTARRLLALGVEAGLSPSDTARIVADVCDVKCRKFATGGRSPPVTLKLFAEEIAAAIREAVAAPAVLSGSAEETGNISAGAPETPEFWRKWLSLRARTGAWPASICGPEPGFGGCRVPKEILAEFETVGA